MPVSPRPYGIDKMDMSEGTAAKRTAFAEKILRMAQKHRPDVEAFGDTDLLKALDEDIGILDSWTKVQRDAKALSALVKDPQTRSYRAALAGSNYTVPCLMRLPGADGKPVDVLIGDASQSKDQGPAVVRVRDGKLLGCLPPHVTGRGALMTVFGQKDFDPFDFAGCYKGSASYFKQMSGPVPAGNKLLIQSSAFMYCIGLREGSGPQVGKR